MSLNVETDEIGAQKAVHEFALPWANAKHFRIGPRNVPEDGHAGVGARFLDHAGKEREVIVLCEKYRGLGALHLLENDVGKTTIDFLILHPVVRAKDGAGVRDVAERPKPFVRKALVVALIFVIGKPDAAQGVTRM